MSSAYPQQQYMPQPPPQKRRTGLIVLAIIGGILVLGLGGCIALVASIGNSVEDTTVTTTEGPAASESERSTGQRSEEPTDEPSKESADKSADKSAGDPYKITIAKCARGEFGTFDVVVKIRNNSDTEKTYLFDVGLYDPDDNTVGSGFGSVEVRPGKSATTDTFASLTDPDYKGKVRCEVEVKDF
jgi:hypothetical protein